MFKWEHWDAKLKGGVRGGVRESEGECVFVVLEPLE